MIIVNQNKFDGLQKSESYMCVLLSTKWVVRWDSLSLRYIKKIYNVGAPRRAALFHNMLDSIFFYMCLYIYSRNDGAVFGLCVLLVWFLDRQWEYR